MVCVPIEDVNIVLGADNAGAWNVAQPPTAFRKFLKNLKKAWPVLILFIPVWFLGGFAGCGLDSPAEIKWNG